MSRFFALSFLVMLEMTDFILYMWEGGGNVTILPTPFW